MIINAENLILGRLASYVAKKALLGETIDIVNSEKIVIVGRRRDILDKYKHRRRRGDALKGPYFPRKPDRLLRRTIRGMLPYKQEKGSNAFKRIKCYINVPEKFKDKNFQDVKEARLKSGIRFIYLKDVVKELGYD